MNVHPYISVLVATYNSESSIETCLYSIINQSFTNFEVIVINDGSTDNTIEIIKYISDKDDRIKIYSQKNSGVSAARNTALDKAVGKFICWVDSDDFIDDDYLESLIAGIDEKLGESALIVQNLNFIPKLSGNNDFKDIIIIRKDFSRLFSELNIENYGYNCGKIFNLNTIKSNYLRFDTDITLSEDLIFMLQYLKHADYVHTIPGRSYNYHTKPYTLQDYKFATFESERKLFLKHIDIAEELYTLFNLNAEAQRIIKKNEAEILIKAFYANYRLNNVWKTTNIRFREITELLYPYIDYIKYFYFPNTIKENISKMLLSLKMVYLFDLYRTIIRDSQKKRLGNEK